MHTRRKSKGRCYGCGSSDRLSGTIDRLTRPARQLGVGCGYRRAGTNPYVPSPGSRSYRAAESETAHAAAGGASATFSARGACVAGNACRTRMAWHGAPHGRTAPAAARGRWSWIDAVRVRIGGRVGAIINRRVCSPVPVRSRVPSSHRSGGDDGAVCQQWRRWVWLHPGGRISPRSPCDHWVHVCACAVGARLHRSRHDTHADGPSDGSADGHHLPTCCAGFGR